MAETVIKADNLGKRYRIGTRPAPADTKLKRIGQAAVSPFSWFASQLRPPHPDEIIWALKDVSFEIRQGDVVGIIGRNGAGKSTLLKILSRITEPSNGCADIRGRIGALLEVGTGMHPELTGRENIFQNGCILGMRKFEIERKFEEIVEFSGVAKFIDTPVKRYSSGMRVRLGFAIAAHLEPEILIVDEVLAVGDVEFQKKCLGKMKDVAGHGRTVLFVSHNMAAIESLCDRAILIKDGGVAYDGDISTAVTRYNETLSLSATTSLRERTDRRGRGQVRFVDIELFDRHKNRILAVEPGGALTIRIHWQALTDLRLEGRIILSFGSAAGVIFNCSTEVTLASNVIFDQDGAIDCHIPSLPLGNGDYWINLYLEAGGDPQDGVQNVTSLQVFGKSFFGTGRDTAVEHSGRFVLVPHQFEAQVGKNATIET